MFSPMLSREWSSSHQSHELIRLEGQERRVRKSCICRDLNVPRYSRESAESGGRGGGWVDTDGAGGLDGATSNHIVGAV
jgi:hypothetical protein